MNWFTRTATPNLSRLLKAVAQLRRGGETDPQTHARSPQARARDPESQGRGRGNRFLRSLDLCKD